MRISFCRLLALSLAGALGALNVQGQGAPRTTTAQPPANSSIVMQAQSLLDSGQIDSAIEMLSAASRFKPNDAQVKHLLGLAYYRKNDYQRAIENLSAVVGRTPESSRQYREQVQILGLSHYLLGHIREAIPYLEQLSQWSPASTEIAYALGISYIQTRNTDKSRETFARIFNIAPASASAYLVNAQMMVRQQFEELAVTELQKALELDPRLPQANFLLGEMAIYHSNIERGIELLQKEIALNPAYGMAYYRLGEAYTRQLKWDEAIGPLQKSIWLNPFFSGPYIVLGKVYLKKNDLPNAENMLRRAVQMDPNNFSGHHLLAQVLQQASRADEAKREFEIAERLRTSADKEP
ncbi:MAG TPA: tetratricopeptide repeat protein [Pyrinomonadaceae bacterium]|nr:tetratricopeptide repeat protein [Pyrinomonadaceae bacterium]